MVRPREARLDALDIDARILGVLLGLGDLQDRERCMGYQNGCRCSECVERERLQREGKRPVRAFPWEDAA